MEGRGSTEEECVMCYIFLDVKAGAPSSLTGTKIHCRGMKVYTHSRTPSTPQIPDINRWCHAGGVLLKSHTVII